MAQLAMLEILPSGLVVVERVGVGISESLLTLDQFGMNICDGFNPVPNSHVVPQAIVARCRSL
jgi:hypothetical protein